MIPAGPFGPRLLDGGGVEFRLWAPAAKRVDVVTAQATPMAARDGGWFRADIPDAGVGSRYKFRIDDDDMVPDPASQFQPEDVFGPSEVVAPHYDWQTQDWKGRPWHEAAILELHVGTFTPGGSFLSAIERLDHVADTGFTAIELMPVADFFGRRNWGYDGVLWFAPDSAHGRPEDLKALVDAAHARRLMVFLDVVYNHFGPEGNFLNRYAPQFFNSELQTPWGAAINYELPEVRAFVVQNALQWIDCYRFDGLRLDAVHAIPESGRNAILVDVSTAVNELARTSGRQIHLVLENDNNEASWMETPACQPAPRYRAQWNDDYHHAWHVLLTGERNAHYADYACGPLTAVARTLTRGFFHQGDVSHFRGATRGEPSAHLPPTAFVSFLQNHDQIGNRALGERLETLAKPASYEAALAIMLLAPMPPLLFMGQEWGETKPFLFFCDFRGELAKAVREGRQNEFCATFAAQDRAAIPDPLAETTFTRSVLDWEKLSQSNFSRRHKLVRDLLTCRAARIVPCLADLRTWSSDVSIDGETLHATWHLNHRKLHLRANLGDAARSADPLPGEVIWNRQSGKSLPPWSVFWTLEE